MEKLGNFICKNKIIILIVSFILLIVSFIGMNLTKVNYDILVYLPENIDTIKGENILTDDFNLGSYSFVVIKDMDAKDILKLEDKIKDVEGVGSVASIYDVIGTTLPIEMLPSDIRDILYQDGYNIMFVTFTESTSNEITIDAVQTIRDIANSDNVMMGGMSSMVLDTMNLSEKEITIYVVIAVVLCLIVLELSLDSYVVPFILLLNIGVAILYNLGSNIFLGQISYITKALVAVLQLGVTTDFSIFLYHSYEDKKKVCKNNEEAMSIAIKETFSSVTGSSLTTIVGFLALCAMQLTLGKDLGIVMAKGVLLGVICVLVVFPSLILVFDKLITKTSHKIIMPNFHKINEFIVKHHVALFVIFLLMLPISYKAYSKVDVYYKLDSSLPETLESIKSNTILKEKFNIVSPSIILVNKNLSSEKVSDMLTKIKDLDGIEFALSFDSLKEEGITTDMLPDSIGNMLESDNYKLILINSSYDVASDDLNNQLEKVEEIVKSYDSSGIVAGEGALIKDLVNISNTDFNNVNIFSIVCIFIVLFIVLKSFSLPFLLIITIEFAIFNNMGISYFNGDVLPFIAPIVLGTIQLGATIDYAILLTNNYIRLRKEGMDKKLAMVKTLDDNGTSILISAMCFFAATFGVGLYSDIEMIGSLCSLISRGALISMAVVILILPGVLLIFDKLISKTQMRGLKKNEK